jgi:hypothetical protein
MKRRVFTFAALLILVAATGLVPTALADDDGGPQTVTMVSGNGPIGGRDPFNEFSRDGGATWQPAYIVNKHPAWANPIPGSEWISVAPDLGFSNPPLQVRYRRFFDLPEDCGTATLRVILHVDDDAFAGTGGGVFLNGVLFGSTPPGPNVSNFQDPPEGPYTTVGPFQEEGNLLEFRTSNIGGLWSGLDYEATLTCTGEGDDDGDDDDDDDGDDG